MVSKLFKLKHLVCATVSRYASFEKSRNRVNILMFHSINSEIDKHNLWDFSSAEFSKTLELFSADENIEIISTRDIENADYNNGKIKLVLSFDDGLRNNYTIAYPILRERKIPFTIFVVPGFLEDATGIYLRNSEILEMVKEGLCDIGVHGFSHRPLASLSKSEITSELRSAKDALEKIIDREVSAISYPHGSVNAEVILVAQELNFRYGFSSYLGSNRVSPHIRHNLVMNRIPIYSVDSRQVVLDKALGKWNWIGQIYGRREASYS